MDGVPRPISLSTIEYLTVDETKALKDAGQKLLKDELDERFGHTRIIATAAGMKVR